MTREDEIKAKLVQAARDGKLISFTYPYAGKHAISVDRHMIDDAMRAWMDLREDDRDGVYASVIRNIKSVGKRMKKKIATPQQMDGLAADCALWLAHQLLFADGERHLIKGPSADDLLKGPSP
ncbi:MAG: hypothetical protein AB7G35_21485 [Hyphomicrobiaceae bacterium]